MLKSTKKFFKKLAFRLLSDEKKEELIRNKIEINFETLPGVVFKVADTKEELLQGFKILYDAYYDEGYIDQNRRGLRITKYHVLPTSTMIVAKIDDEVVGTVTHVMDSNLGLPIEGELNIGELRQKSRRIAEISALAIKKEYRHNQSIFLGMTRYLYHYGVASGVEHWVICIKKDMESFYKAIFFFKNFSHLKKSFHYEFANGSESVVLYSELDKQPENFKEHFGKREKSKNLFNFYLKDFENPFMKSDDLFYPKIFRSLTYERVHYFFNECEKIFFQLNNSEKVEVFNSHIVFRSIIDKKTISDKNYAIRSTQRFLVYLSAEMIKVGEDFENNFTKVYILNASLGGLLIFSEKPIPVDERYIVRIQLGPVQKTQLKVTVKSIPHPKKYGVALIEEVTPLWKMYMDYLGSNDSDDDNLDSRQAS